MKNGTIRSLFRMSLFPAIVIASMASSLVFSGCQTLKEFASLRNVQFSLGQLSNIDLAGVRLDTIDSYSDLTPRDVLKLTTALARRDVPLRFQLDLKAQNPSDNQVAARLVKMDWTLFLENRETISGVIDEERVLNPGEPIVIPLMMELELMQFFDDNIRDLVELGLSLAGEGGASKEVKLEARPVVSTVLGPISYPGPITVVNASVG